MANFAQLATYNEVSSNLLYKLLAGQSNESPFW